MLHHRLGTSSGSVMSFIQFYPGVICSCDTFIPRCLGETVTHSHEPGSPGTLRASADFGTKVTRPSVTGHRSPAAEKISCEDKEPYKVYSGVVFAQQQQGPGPGPRIPIRCAGGR